MKSPITHRPAVKEARNLRRNRTQAESHLWNRLREADFDGLRFRRQHPIGGYIVDFVCLKKRLIIEIDGGQHAINQDRDLARTEWLEHEGYRVIRFWNNEVLTNMEGVMFFITEALDKVSPSPGLSPLRERDKQQEP